MAGKFDSKENIHIIIANKTRGNFDE